MDSERVLGLLSHYADASGLEFRPEVIHRDLVARLIHAARRKFGLLIEMTIATIEATIRDGRTDVEIAGVARMFRKRSGCVDGLNPFIADDFERIDVTHDLLRPEGLEALEGVGCSLHAGDIGESDHFDALPRFALVTAIRGNIDRVPWAHALPETVSLTTGGLRIHMIHDHDRSPRQ